MIFGHVNASLPFALPKVEGRAEMQTAPGSPPGLLRLGDLNWLCEASDFAAADLLKRAVFDSAPDRGSA